jgi:hypothetical protein
VSITLTFLPGVDKNKAGLILRLKEFAEKEKKDDSSYNL